MNASFEKWLKEISSPKFQLSFTGSYIAFNAIFKELYTNLDFFSVTKVRELDDTYRHKAIQCNKKMQLKYI